MGSGSGKTVVACGLLALMKKRGFAVRCVKCGPDYIDPMFHRRVLGIRGSNADLFLMGEASVRRSLCGAAGHTDSFFGGGSARQSFCESGSCADSLFEESVREGEDSYVLAEGAMGFYDGIGGTTENSAFDISDRTDTSVVLVIRSRGQSISLAAQVLGFLNFRRPSHICGLLLTECSPSLYDHLCPILERETGLPVLGYLPAMEEAKIPQRHLGLVTAEEISDFRERFGAIAEQMERTVDVERLLGLFRDGLLCDANVKKSETVLNDSCVAMSERKEYSDDADLPDVKEDLNARYSDDADLPGMNESMSAGDASFNVSGKSSCQSFCQIAVAYDEAFCFYYSESLEALREAGAELVFFSPLHDRSLPPGITGLYLGGGYPELYAGQLGENRKMRDEIREAFARKIPTVAECGGFLYLQKVLEGADGLEHQMAGVFSGSARPAGHLVRFGYIYLEADRDSLLFRKGEVVPAHEFHHWDTDDNGSDLAAVRARDVISKMSDADACQARDVILKRISADSWRCGHVSDHLYAGFPHLALGGAVPLAERFVEAAGRINDSR